MEPDVVASELADRAERLRASLTDRWGEVPHRVREPIRVPQHDFPETPDDLFPWVAVCFVSDDGQILLVRDSGHSFPWEPPGGKGEARDASESESGERRERGGDGETVAGTAERETREETGVECEVTDLLFTETLRFDYGAPAFAPVLQAGFVARRVGGRIRADEEDIVTAAWFPMDELPDGTQFRGNISSLASD
ncbi:NUDIX hydrolase [Haladaptatus salinisoli]|uniref:NUDIX hydrolase n=1 Tax=Haladaptatus salinisoli TaxID=2884876 RepID=UPI001D0BC983|nr:NUDIX domain-containing protein [Haladaptatus salinisoli]